MRVKKMLRLAVAVSCLLAVLASPVLDNDMNKEWEMYKNVHNKVYGSQEEETLRRMIWEDNGKFIARHNKEFDMGLHTYTVGINQYSDLSFKEFVATLNGYNSEKMSNSSAKFLLPSNFTIPTAVDWRTKGYVTDVKNQLQCGSCWAFSTTGSLEGQHFKKTGQLVSLSEQNLIDCSRAEGNQGCQGGHMNNAFSYILRNGGINTEMSYPYTGLDGGKCRFNRSYVGATVTGYKVLPSDERTLQYVVATVGPISAAMDAGHRSFQFYKSGVYYEEQCSSINLNHAVLVVGYGYSRLDAYWLVKNSWGKGWGQNGYVWMARNRHNMCGIASRAGFPTV